MMSDVLLGLISVQSVCKGYQQTTGVGNELKSFFSFFSGSEAFPVIMCIVARIWQ